MMPIVMITAVTSDGGKSKQIQNNLGFFTAADVVYFFQQNFSRAKYMHGVPYDPISSSNFRSFQLYI